MGDLLYRQCLEEKLKDISGTLKIGRDSFSIDSKLYKNLNKSIKNILDFLDEHSGEEWLSKEDKDNLEDKIRLMKEAALPYKQDKLKKGALSDNPKYMRKRYRASVELLAIPSKIPDNPSEEHGIIQPDVLEPGDKPETDWRLKYKQNIRYLAKKQIATYEQKYKNLEQSNELLQDEFDALMDIMEPEKVLTYKKDGDLCQKYPSMRIMLEKAVRASEKLRNMNNKDVADYMYVWSKSAKEKSKKNIEKAFLRSGRTLSDKDRKNEEEKYSILIKEKVDKYNNINALIEKGDELEQVARFFDLKMKIISDKNYVRPLKAAEKTGTVENCEKLIQNSIDPKEKRYYRNLRDLRELESVGIKHYKPKTGIEKALYKKVDETAYKTVKREFLGFRIGKPGFKGIGAINDSYGADSNSTLHAVRYGGDMKARVGKIGLKLHTKRKHLQLSGGIVLGQVKSSATIGASYVSPDQDALLAGETSAIKARIKLKAGTENTNLSVGANASVGYLFGSLKAGLGQMTVKDADGKERTTYGIAGNIGGVATAFKGGGSGSVSFLGIKIGVSLTGYAAGIGGDIGGSLTVGSANFSIAGALGIGAGLAISIDWNGAIDRVKKLWSKSKLSKIIKDYKEKKKAAKAARGLSKPKDKSGKSLTSEDSQLSGKAIGFTVNNKREPEKTPDTRYRVQLDEQTYVRGKLKNNPLKQSMREFFNLYNSIDEIEPGPLTKPEKEPKPQNITGNKTNDKSKKPVVGKLRKM